MIKKCFLGFLTLFFCVGWTAAQIENCGAILENALEYVQDFCARTARNQACYGYHTLTAQLSPGLTEFAFNNVGDITPISTIESLRLSPFDPDDEWGITVMRISAAIPDMKTDEAVTLIAFGGVTLNPDQSGDYQPMQAFTFSSEASTSGCTDVTENGVLIQTPEGAGRITLWINQVKISIGSTVLFQAQPGGHLSVSTFEGSAQVESMGQMQDAIAGTTVLVPMDLQLRPDAPPSLPQPFDGGVTGLMPVIEVLDSFTDHTGTQRLFTETQLPDDNPASTEETSSGNEGAVSTPVVNTSIPAGEDDGNNETFVSTPPPVDTPQHNVDETTVPPTAAATDEPDHDNTPIPPTSSTKPPSHNRDDSVVASVTPTPSPPTTQPTASPTSAKTDMATSTPIVPTEIITDESNDDGISISPTETPPTELPPSTPLVSDSDPVVTSAPPPPTDDSGDAPVSSTIEAPATSEVEETVETAAPPTSAPGDTSDQNDCNRDHGKGNPNGHCYGHDHGNHGNGNNGNGNGNGRGNN